MKKVKTIFAALLVALAALAAIMLYFYRTSVFQRGNPVPYLIAAVQISESKPYVEVEDGSGVCISMRGECPELLDYFQEKTGMDFVEQSGSGYLFADGTDTAVISPEVYWKYFTVWELPDVAPVAAESPGLSGINSADEDILCAYGHEREQQLRSASIPPSDGGSFRLSFR